MKVLRNNYHNDFYKELDEPIPIIEPYPRKLECEKCGSELEYDKSDLEVGVLGAMHVKCPLCEHMNMLDGNENDIVLTMENVNFPVHFFHHSTEDGTVDVCNNEEIRKYIKRAIKYFRENKNEYCYYVGTGNMLLHVYRYEEDEEYYVVVSKNYYDTYIPFEPTDY